jgi:hypothetical protein
VQFAREAGALFQRGQFLRLLVQARIFDGHGDQVRQRRHHLNIRLMETVFLIGGDVEHADEPVGQDHRHGHLGAQRWLRSAAGFI